MAATIKHLRFYKDQWYSNHRHQGGLPAIIRCLRGTRIVNALSYLDPPATHIPSLTSLTFSVFPKLTALWTECFFNSLDKYKVFSIIGDCSGGYSSITDQETQAVYPYSNIEHGNKLDIFIKKLCNSDYIIICDDDVFWLNDQPLNYALTAFSANSKLAVVSLMPRSSKVPQHLSSTIDSLMGSYCLVIKQSIWQKEGLSFAIKPFPPGSDSGWYYDTSDDAHQVLIHRGYEVLIAPDDLRQNLITFEGISSWLLKIQKYKGNIHRQIKDVHIKKEKAYSAILVAEELSKILKNKFHLKKTDIVNKQYLNSAKSICDNLISESRRFSIENHTLSSINRINNLLINEDINS